MMSYEMDRLKEIQTDAEVLHTLTEINSQIISLNRDFYNNQTTNSDECLYLIDLIESEIEGIEFLISEGNTFNNPARKPVQRYLYNALNKTKDAFHVIKMAITNSLDENFAPEYTGEGDFENI